MRLVRYLAVLLMLAAGSTAAVADTWAPPKRTTVYSSDRSHRFTMTPRDLSSSLAYFEDAVKGKERPGQRPGKSNKTPGGRLERRSTDGQWVIVWGKPLINDVAPVDTVVANSGKFVATLDNWHFMGLDDHVVVTYASDGTLIRSLKLSELLPDFYIKALPHSVSSIHWRGDAQFRNDDKLLIKIVVPTSDGLSGDARFVDLLLDPQTGASSPAVPSEWQSALTEAHRVASEKDAAERERRVFFTAPLVGPTAPTERDWHKYLTEVFFRLDPDWEDGFPNIEVLRSPSASDYQPSAGWLRDALLEKELPADVLMIASPSSPDNLLVELNKTVGMMPRGKLKHARIYIVAPPSHREPLLQALSPTGAKLIYIDPAVAISQRPERLKQFAADWAKME